MAEAAPSTLEGAGLDAGQPESGLTHRQILIVFSGLMLGMLLAALDQTIVATALPTIVGDLHGLNKLSWVVTAYLLTSTATAPLYGKIADLYGRKRVFQAAIVIFLAGSALSGLAQSMSELILFRGLQGLGAGGLIVLATTIIGDIVSPRERGRYQGYFGAVFGVASVAGPLIGGFLVDGPGWRWVFYVNLPIGALALVVTSVVLKDTFLHRQHKVDYAGAFLALAGVSALLLVTVWGGTSYPWSSPTILALAAAGILLVAGFILRERVAAEPIMPLRLFRFRVFNVANATGFVVGMLMLGSTIYLPVYLQTVHGVSPSTSGMLMLPLMLGLLITSISSGQIIARVGRYKIFPIIGTSLAVVGMFFLSHLDATTPYVLASTYMFILGAGVGCVMQVLVLAVQNGVEYKDLGVATALATFFRSMGGAFGTAIFGSILASRLAHNLPLLTPRGTSVAALSSAITGSPQSLKRLPVPIHDAAVEAFVRSLHSVFSIAVPIAIVSLILAVLLPEIRLRRTIRTEGVAPAEEAQAAASLGPAGDAPPLDPALG